MLGPRTPNSIARIVACGVGSVAGDLAAVTVKLVRNIAWPFSPWATSTMYFPGSSFAWISLFGPGFASTSNAIEASLETLFRSPFAFFSFWNASASATLTPGFRSATITAPSFSPVSVTARLTPPDSRLPLTLAEDELIAIERVGSVAACTEPATTRLAAAMSPAVAESSVVRNVVFFIFGLPPGWVKPAAEPQPSGGESSRTSAVTARRGASPQLRGFIRQDQYVITRMDGYLPAMAAAGFSAR